MFALVRFRGVLVAVIALAAVGLACASASGGGRASEGAGGLRPHTVLVTPTEWGISGLRADGQRLVWLTDQRHGKLVQPVIQIFNRRTGGLTTMGNYAGPAYGAGIASFEFTGKRLLEAAYFEDSPWRYSILFSAAIDDHRPHKVGEFGTQACTEFDALGSEYYTLPVRIAAGGGDLVFFGVDSYRGEHGLRRQSFWRLQGRQRHRLPYELPLPASIAVDGRRLATLEFATTGLNSEPAISPDGREIAWTRDGRDIWLTNADGSNQRRLVSGSVSPEGWDVGSDPTWSPDGTTLAFTNRSGDTPAIELIGRDGSSRRRLVDGYQPVWSPNGKTLAFRRGTNDWLVAPDGSGLRQLSDNCCESGRPAWSPDGTTLAVERDSEIYLFDVASGKARNLTTSGFDPAWSPDGKWIAFSRRIDPEGNNSAVYLIRPDGSDLHKITGPSLNPSALAWSHDGTRLAYAAGYCGSGKKTHWSEVRIVQADGSAETTLQHHNPILANPVWSPDGKTIVAGDYPDHRSNCSTGGLEALDPAGGPSRWLAPPEPGTAALELRDVKTGELLRQWQLPWQRPLRGVSDKLLWLAPWSSPVRVRRPYGTVALSGRYLLATYWRPGSGPALDRYDTESGALLGTSPFPASDPPISLAGRYGVYSVGRRVYLLDAKSGRKSLLATTSLPVTPIMHGTHVLWAENQAKGGGHYSSRIRELVLP